MTGDTGNEAQPCISADRRRAFLNQQVFSNAAPVIILVNPLVAAVVAITLWGVVRPSWLIALVCASLLLAGVNIGIDLAWRRAGDRDSNPDYWHRRLIGGATLNGAVWGIGMSGILLLSVAPLGTVLPIIVIAGFGGGYVAAQSASMESVTGFMLAAFGPLTTAILMRGGSEAVPLALLMGLYAAALCYFAWNNHRQIVQSLTLRLQNETLLENLQTTQRSLIDARNAALAMNRAKSQFLAMMSHELRTPLNAILGFADIIANQQFGPCNQPRYVEYAQDIHTSGGHLLALVNDILDLSKIEAGRMEIAPEPFDVADAVRSTLRLQRMKAEQAGVSLSVDLSPDAAHIVADHRAIRQILFNLVGNAIKFTPSGGSVIVRSEPGADAETIVLSVHDTGIGIAPDDIDRVLRPFEQANNSYARAVGGTGLGLSLAKALTELHGGALHLTSTPGQGTQVDVHLPRNAAGPALTRPSSAI